MVRCTISYDANEALSSYDELPDDLEGFSKMFNERTFNRDLEIIVRGFSAMYGLPLSEDASVFGLICT